MALSKLMAQSGLNNMKKYFAKYVPIEDEIKPEELPCMVYDIFFGLRTSILLKTISIKFVVEPDYSKVNEIWNILELMLVTAPV